MRSNAAGILRLGVTGLGLFVFHGSLYWRVHRGTSVSVQGNNHDHRRVSRPEHVRALTTDDVIYVSLNFDNPELHKVMPWTGTNRGPHSIVDVFNGIGRVWETKAFEIQDVIANDTAVAMFGSFTYKTRTLGKEITSPFALLAKVTSDQLHTVYGRHLRHRQHFPHKRHLGLPRDRIRRRSQRGILTVARCRRCRA